MHDINNTDHVKDFRSIRLCIFFRRLIRKNKTLKFFVNFLLWKTFSIYQYVKFRIKDNFKARRYVLIGLRKYVENYNFDKILLHDKVSVLTPSFQVFPIEKSRKILSSHGEYTFPAIYVAIIDNGVVIGNTNLLIAGDFIIHHDLYDSQRDFTREEMHGRAFLWASANRIAWLGDSKIGSVINSAAVFTDACSANYAHWITEVLPRINLFCNTERFNNVPIIVNSGLHVNLLESLQLVVGSSRKIIFINNNEMILVKNLYVVSVVGYVPFQRKNNKLENHSHGVFSSVALSLLRNTIKNSMLDKPLRGNNKIFVRRNSNIRNIINEKEIEGLLVDHGFVVIEPEKMTFAEQFAVFSTAEIVVGATGAAFGNIVFCKPGVKIVIMISDYKYMSYWYWQNMACSVGNTVTYVIGKCERFKHLHVDFIIDGEDVLNAIK